MWKCPVCGSENKSMLCSCGFDESQNYAKYPTLMPIGSAAIQTNPEETQKNTKIEQPPSPNQWWKKPVLKYTACAILILSLVLVMITIPKQEPEDSDTSLPSMRMMTSDCSTVLLSAGHSGAVLEVQVQDQDISERFKVLTVTCAVEVLEEDGHQQQYVVELLYEFKDDTWHFSTLSNLKQ